MLFWSGRDFALAQHLNQELINNLIDIQVTLFKIILGETKTNSFGEAPSKKWYSGVQFPCLTDVSNDVITADITNNVEQAAKFYIRRQECIDRNLYPEIGDILLYNQWYFEIDNLNDIQLIAGQPMYNFSIVVSAHLTRTTTLQLEQPNI